jgi:hypothetical protein
VPVHVHVPWSKHKTPAQLKRILPEPMLSVSSGPSPLACDRIVTPQQMQERGPIELGCPVRLPLLVNQQRKMDAGLIAKSSRVREISKPDGG